MDAKEYLSQAYKVHREIEAKINHRECLRVLAEGGTSQMNSLGVQTARKDKMQEFIVKMIILQNEIDKDLNTLVEKETLVKAVIDKVENSEYRALLTYRYLCFDKWEDIAEKMYYDRMTIYRKHIKSLNEVAVIINAVTQCYIDL